MLKTELRRKLTDTMLFEVGEIDSIVQTVGSYSIGNAIVACEIIGIELTGSDIDIMFQDN